MVSASGSSAPEILREGITIVFDNVGTASGNRGVDYVLLHGLNGHPKNTWTSSTDFYWPWHLREHLDNARVMVYGYNADFERAWISNKASIKTIAESFISALIDEREDEIGGRPLVLVAHSLGGLVIKRAIITIHQDRSAGSRSLYVRLQNQIYDSITGLVFLGTPHAGSNVTEKKRVKLLQALAKSSFKEAPAKIIKALEANSDELVELSDAFEKTTIFSRHEVNVCTYYETRSTPFLGEEVVPEAMTVLHYINGRREGISADHHGMVKFHGQQDNNFKKVMKELKRMGGSEKSDEIVPEDPRLVMKIIENYAEAAHEDLEKSRARLGQLGIALDDSNWLTKLPEYLTWSSSAVATMLWYLDRPENGEISLLRTHGIGLLDRQRHDQTIEVAYTSCLDSGGNSRALSSITILRSTISQILWNDERRIALIERSIASNFEADTTMKSLLEDSEPKIEVSYSEKQPRLIDSRVKLDDLWALLRLVLRTVPEQKMYIMVDDIDVLDGKDQIEFVAGLLRLWRSLQQRPVIVSRILISSRKPGRLPEILKGIPAIDEDVERRHCLNSLFFNELHSRRNRVLDPQHDTDQWIWRHDTYSKWLKKHSSILWIQGKAGSGKSTLAKMIQKTLLVQAEAGQKTGQAPAKASIVADYFYSIRGGSKETSHVLMLRSLLYQILEQQPRLYELFKAPFRRLLHHSHGQMEWPYAALEALLLSLALEHGNGELSEFCDRIYILLDALDESEDEDGTGRRRSEILALLTTLCTKRGSISIKVILFSRPTVQLQMDSKDIYHIRIDEENRTDVSKIVDAGLRLMWKAGCEKDEASDCDSDMGSGDQPATPLPSEEWDSERSTLIGSKYLDPQDNEGAEELDFVKDYLVKQASGVILWVVLILGELIRHVEAGSYTTGEINEKLHSLPTDLGLTYQEIIRRLQRRHSAQDIIQSRLMLIWATFADRPLNLREFRDALAISTQPGNNQDNGNLHAILREKRLRVSRNNWAPVRRRIVHMCGGLLETVNSETKNLPRPSKKLWHVSPTDSVQLLHQTVKDFLLLDQSSVPFHLDPLDDQNYIFMAAVRYLRISLPMKKLQAVPTYKWKEKDLAEFVEHLQDRPLLGYVLSSLPRRIRESEENTISQDFFDFYQEIQGQPWGHAYEFLEGWWRKNQLDFPSTGTVGSLKSNVNNISRMVKTHLNEKTPSVTFRTRCLQAAAKAGNLEVLQVMLEVRDSFQGLGRALHFATLRKHVKGVQLLLDNGASVTEVDYKRRTALHLASIDGEESITRLLLTHGADIDSRDILGRTALHYAALKHRLLTVFLLEHGAKVGVRDKDYMTPLHLAAQEGNTETMQVLIKCVADTTAFLFIAQGSPLHRAAAGGHVSAAQLLLDHGAHIDARGYREGSALCVAAGRGEVEFVRLLLERGADLEISEQRTALHQAVMNRHKDVALLLLVHGAEVNVHDQTVGMTPLHTAAQKGDVDIIELLLNHGADVTAEDSHQATALHMTALAGHYEAAQALMKEEKININARTSVGISSLDLAVKRGHETLSLLLLSRGAEPRASAHSNTETVQEVAFQHNHGTVSADTATITKGHLIDLEAEYETFRADHELAFSRVEQSHSEEENISSTSQQIVDHDDVPGDYASFFTPLELLNQNVIEAHANSTTVQDVVDTTDQSDAEQEILTKMSTSMQVEADPDSILNTSLTISDPGVPSFILTVAEPN